MQPLTAIRITDPHIIKRVEEARAKRGERSCARTAGNLIIERLTIAEVSAGKATASIPSPVSPEPSAA